MIPVEGYRQKDEEDFPSLKVLKSKIEYVIRKGSNDDRAKSGSVSSESVDHSGPSLLDEDGLENLETVALSPNLKSPVMDSVQLENVELELEQNVRGNPRSNRVRQLVILLATVINVYDTSYFTDAFMNHGKLCFMLIYFIQLVLFGIPFAILEMAMGQFVSIPASNIFGRIAPIFSGVGVLLCYIRMMYSLFYVLSPRYLIYLCQFLMVTFTNSFNWLQCQTNELHCQVPSLDGNDKEINGLAQTNCGGLKQNSIGYQHQSSHAYITNILQNASLTYTPMEYYWQYLNVNGYVETTVASFVILAISAIVAFNGTKYFSKLCYLLTLIPFISLFAPFFFALKSGHYPSLHELGEYEGEHFFTDVAWLKASLVTAKSLGIYDGTLLMFGSISDFKNNLLHDILYLAAASFVVRFLSLFAVVPMWTVNLHAIPETFQTWDKIVFTVLPSLSQELGFHTFVCCFFFFGMTVSMIAYQIMTYEIGISVCLKSFPRLLYLSESLVRYCVITAFLCIFSMAVAIVYYVDLGSKLEGIEKYAYLDPVLIYCLFELFIFVFLYGSRRLVVNITTMCESDDPQPSTGKMSAVFSYCLGVGTNFLTFSWKVLIFLHIYVFLFFDGILLRFSSINPGSVFFVCISAWPIYFFLRKIVINQWNNRSFHTLFQRHRKWGPINIHNKRAAEHDERAARLHI